MGVSDTVFGEFIWNTAKASQNLDKHGVSFEEAALAVDDPNAIVREDNTTHGNLIAIGCSLPGRILFVVHVERRDRIRIISARRASRHQAGAYARR